MSLHDNGIRASPLLWHLRSNTDLPDCYYSLGLVAVIKAFTSLSSVV